MSTEVPNRSVVLGLDGIPWNLLSSWAEDGELPRFEELLETGTAGPLESTVPPTTALAWPSIATGVRPDKHGIYSFRRLTESYTKEMNTSRHLEQPTLWEMLSPSVAANVPMTYPAREIDGKMVTGMMTPSMNDGFTHPSELSGDIEETIQDYEIGLNWQEYHGREETFFGDISQLLAARRELMRQLMETEDWELFFFVYTEPDRLQHLVWDEDTLLDHYRDLDDILGEVMEYASANDANLFVVSDHGFGPISRFVHVNTILEQSGLLRPKAAGGSRGVLERVGVTKSRVRGLLKRLNAESVLLTVLPDTVVDEVANQIPGEHSLYDVDFSHTDAFCHGYGNVYINDSDRFVDGPVSPDDRAALKERVAAVLDSAEHPVTDDPLLTVHDGAELFPTDSDAPDLVVKAIDDSEVDTSLSEERLTDTETKSGSHRSEGIFLARGPSIDAGARVTGLSVFDVAPTLLHSQLKPVPEAADGRVLDIFTSGSGPATTDPETTEYRPAEDTRERGGSEFDDVEDRLRGLGYID